MKISIIIPTYRSEDNLPVLLDRLQDVMRTEGSDYEIIVVDDHSPDHTLTYLRLAGTIYPAVKAISLSRNFGQQVAISAGLQHMTGDAAIIMDDDLQDPPEFIPVLISKWKEGYDIVYAIKSNRKENGVKRLGYKLFYRILSVLSEIEVPEDSGDFCIMSTEIVTILNSMKEKGRFIRGLRAWVGYRQIGIPCDRGRRHMGEPAYTFSRIVRLSLDGIFSMSNKPLKVIFAAGFIMTICSLLVFHLALIQWVFAFISPGSAFSQRAWFHAVLPSIFLVGGLQLMGMGILGEYIGRIFNEVRNRPVYLIKEYIGFDLTDRPVSHL